MSAIAYFRADIFTEKAVSAVADALNMTDCADIFTGKAVSAIADEVCARLDTLGIKYDRVSHPPVLTIADCAETDAKLNAVTAKNYFLTTKNQKRFYLCLARPEARFVTKDVSKQVASPRLSFASDEKLWELLGVKSGSVSPLALMFDSAKDVTLLVDSRLYAAERLAFHPCDNTQTAAMSAADFFGKFLPAVGVEPVRVEMENIR